MEEYRAVRKHFISLWLMSFPVSWQFPSAIPTCQRITGRPAHVSVLLSSPTQGHSFALYLMQLVWCFSDIPSCCHHYTHSYSCALCSHCSISYFNVRSIFIPRYKIHSIKKTKKQEKTKNKTKLSLLSPVLSSPVAADECQSPAGSFPWPV